MRSSFWKRFNVLCEAVYWGGGGLMYFATRFMKKVWYTLRSSLWKRFTVLCEAVYEKGFNVLCEAVYEIFGYSPRFIYSFIYCYFFICLFIAFVKHPIGALQPINKGVDSVRQTSNLQRGKQQQRPESPTVTITWHAGKHKVHKLRMHETCIGFLCFPKNKKTKKNSPFWTAGRSMSTPVAARCLFPFPFARLNSPATG